MKKTTGKKVWLVFYTFLAVFQPPVLPMSLIYIFGFITVILLLYNNQLFMRCNADNSICVRSTISKTYVCLLCVAAYMVVMSFFNIMSSADLLTNRLQCLNQLLVLTGIEFLSVWYIILKSKELHYEYLDIMKLVITVGILQGLCAVFAYIFPQIRALFTRFGGDIYDNEYVWARRGYGFSAILLDTFGYGMGIICGCILFLPSKCNKLYKLIGLVLCLFSILMNSRTGFVIFGIGLVIFLPFGGSKKNRIMRILVSIALLALSFLIVIPNIIRFGQSSDNVTIQWVSNSLDELYQVLFSTHDLKNATFISNIYFSDDILEIIFGSGHSIYGTFDQLGIHSDIGYVNLIWTYGILGSLLIFSIFGNMFVNGYRSAENSQQKCLVVFLMLSYIVTMLKAILIGYNPGTMLTYLLIFSMIYLGKQNNNIFIRQCRQHI